MQIHSNGCNRPSLAVKPDHSELAFYWISNEMPGLVAPGGKGGRGTSGGNVFHAVVGGASSVANVTNLGNLAPGHAGVLSVQVNDELAHLRGQRILGCSRSALLP
jgi:hypothetical protein